MNHTFLSLKENIANLPQAFNTTVWEFIRGDIATSDFERIHLYNNPELYSIFNEPSYDFIMMTDYKDKSDVIQVKHALFDLLTRLPINCLCPTMFSATRFTIESSEVYSVLYKYLMNLQKIKSLVNFQGQPPINQSSWYCDAELGRCKTCGTVWFLFFEESFCDYHLVRLTQSEFDIMKCEISWPNDKWPERLRSFTNFIDIEFKLWRNIYSPNKFKDEITRDTLNNLSSWI